MESRGSGQQLAVIVGWLLGLVAIGLLAWLAVHLMGVTLLDRYQQQPLVMALARWNIRGAFVGSQPPQTSGPGFGIFAVPLYWVVQPHTLEERVYDIVSFATLVPLGIAAIAASRAVGVAARSARELLNVAAVVLGSPILACFTEVFHPADVLATAACLGAYAAVVRGRIPLAAALLGFAVATRQWAVVPILVLATLLPGRDRWRLLLGSVLATAVIMLPFFVAEPRATLDALRAGDVIRGQLTAAALIPLSDTPLYLLSRVVPLVLAAVWCAWLYRRRAVFTPELAVVAIAVALLARPLVDPAGFLYYIAPGYAFCVLVRPRSWTWPVAGLVGGLALWIRRELRLKYPLLEYDDDLNIHIVAAGVPFSIATTLLLAVVLLAAIERTVQLLGSDPDGSEAEPAPSGPRHAEASDGLLR